MLQSICAPSGKNLLPLLNCVSVETVRSLLFSSKQRRVSVFLFQRPRHGAKGDRYQDLLLCSHTLFGSVGHLVSVEQMRLEAAPGVWLLSSYAVSVRSSSFPQRF